MTDGVPPGSADSSAPAGRPVWFLVPGPLDTRTGGFIYDRQMIDGLKRADRLGGIIETPDVFPGADPATIVAIASEIASVPEGSVLVVDGLAATDLSPVLKREAERLALIALIHHPLADENNADPRQVQALFDAERDMLEAPSGVIVTSPSTARRLADFGVGASRLATVLPGTDPRPVAEKREGPPRILCVATLSRRKAQDVLIDALEQVQDLDWRTDLAGAERDPSFAEELDTKLAVSPVRDRIIRHGEVSEDRLEQLWRSASLFVLPSRHEGYGMALAEALARGVPVISTRAGAIPDTVPAGAGVLVEPGNANALAAALRGVIEKPELMRTLSQGALAAGRTLPSWSDAQANFIESIDRHTASGDGDGA